MIRDAGYGDYHAMACMHSANFERGWGADEIRSLLEQPGTKAFIFEHENDRAGFVLLRCVADECEILTIAVDKTHKRKGIGRKLIDHARLHASREGAKKIFLEVAEDNEAAQGLYAACGYAEHGRRVGYYRRWHGRRIDALMLMRDTDEQL